MFYTKCVSFFPVETWFLDLYSTVAHNYIPIDRGLFNSKFGSKPLDKIDVKDFAMVFGGALKATLATPPKDRTIGR